MFEKGRRNSVFIEEKQFNFRQNRENSKKNWIEKKKKKSKV